MALPLVAHALLLLAALEPVSSQSYATGIGKATHCVSNASATLRWMLQHLPVAQDDAGFDCAPLPPFPGPFGCACGQIGRVELTRPPGRRGLGFGLHTVATNSSVSERPMGPLPIAEIEGHVRRKLRAAAATGGYDALLDFSSGFWVQDLDPYIREFAGTATLAMEWRDQVNQKTYFSLQVQVAEAFAILEFMSERQTLLPARRYRAPQPRFLFRRGESPRSVFGDMTASASGKPIMHMARISHYTSDVSRDASYYQQVLGRDVGTTLENEGVHALVLSFADITSAPNSAQLHLVQRPATNTSGALSVKQLEQAMNSVHASTLTSDVCGWDQFMDFHYAIHRVKGFRPLSDVLPKISALGFKYHILTTWPNELTLVAVTPNGISIEIHGMANGTYQPSVAPGTCGQLCDVGPPSCPVAGLKSDDAIAEPRGSVASGYAQLRKCIPNTLGSEAFRKYQSFSLSSGRITQPYNDGQCLTVTNSLILQNQPALNMQPCSKLLAANQTWKVAAEQGRIASASSGMCLDVQGGKATEGALLHLWSCVPRSSKSAADQQFTWLPDGAITSALDDGLCIDTSNDDAYAKPCGLAPENESSWCNRSLSAATRAAALIAAVGDNETLLAENLKMSGPGFSKLRVPAPQMGEALHGVKTSCLQSQANLSHPTASTGCATSFPTGLALGATFNRSLWSKVGEVIGREARAMTNMRQGGAAIYFAPNVNLYRDPRWGRGMETPGEDPLTTGEYGARFVAAAQAQSASGLRRVVLAPKHYLDYDLEGRKWWPGDKLWPMRREFNAIVSKQEQTEYFLPAWHATMTIGQPGGVMCATSAVNGVDSCMNPTYLEGFLRGTCSFSGFVVTDGNSCGNTNCQRTVAATHPQCANTSAWARAACQELAAQYCLRAGTDIEIGSTLPNFAAKAVASGLLPPTALARSNTRLYEQAIAQGHLDEGTANDEFGADDVDTPYSRQLAFDAAVSSMVLLQNEAELLPLLPSSTAPKALLKIALIGPHLNSTDSLLAGVGYAGENRLVQQNTILDAFNRRAARPNAAFTIVGSAAGCNIATGCADPQLASVHAAIAEADVVVAFVGLYPTGGGSRLAGGVCSESEAFDRLDIRLCGRQQDLLEVVVSARKKLATVLISGGTIDLTWIKQHSGAILEGFYPGKSSRYCWDLACIIPRVPAISLRTGQAGGEAVAAVLLGEAAPSGRLPVTLYDSSVVTSRNITDMSLRSNDGLTYMHYSGKVVFPFGLGLSFTRWSMTTSAAAPGWTATTHEIAAAYRDHYSRSGLIAPPFATLTVSVRNLGLRTSDVVVQAFATNTAASPAGAPANPLRQLAGFARAAAIEPDGKRDIQVGMEALAFTRVDSEGSRWAEPALWRVQTTLDGLRMQNVSLAVTGPKLRVLSWPPQPQPFEKDDDF